jgi:hypothetical protein
MPSGLVLSLRRAIGGLWSRRSRGRAAEGLCRTLDDGLRVFGPQVGGHAAGAASRGVTPANRCEPSLSAALATSSSKNLPPDPAAS